MSVVEFAQIYLFSLVFLTGLWANFDVSFWPAVLLLAALPSILRRFDHEKTNYSRLLSSKNILFEKKHFLLSLLLGLPALLQAVFVNVGETPFSGDHHYHLDATRHIFSFYGNSAWIIAVLGLLFLFHKKGSRISYFPLAILVLWGASYFIEPPIEVARYPGGFYFLTLPMVLVQKIFFVIPPLFVVNVTNAISIFLYLWVLRPWIFKRQVDAAAIFITLAFYWQKDVVYYSASSYLEPWSLVAALISIEALLTQDKRDWLACWCIGAGAMIKEQIIIFLPFVWLASFATSFKKPKTELPRALAHGLISGIPFLIYYSSRKNLGIWRKVDLLGFTESFTKERLLLFLARQAEQFGHFYILAIVGIFVFLGYYRAKNKKAYPLLLMATLAQGYIFFADKLTATFAYEGYPRFHLQIYALLTMLSLPFFLNVKNKRLLLPLFIVVAVLQLGPTLNLLDVSLLHRWKLVQFEHRDSPQYYPYEEITRKAANDGLLKTGDEIKVNNPSPEHRTLEIERMDPKLWRQYRWTQLNAWECACGGTRAILQPVFLPVRKPVANYESALSCVSELKKHCEKWEEVTVDGKTWALLAK